jgi:hypothetical protein
VCIERRQRVAVQITYTPAGIHEFRNASVATGRHSFHFFAEAISLRTAAAALPTFSITDRNSSFEMPSARVQYFSSCSLCRLIFERSGVSGLVRRLVPGYFHTLDMGGGTIKPIPASSST